MFLAFCPGLAQQGGGRLVYDLLGPSVAPAVWVLLLCQKDWRSVKLLLNKQTRGNANSFTSTGRENLWTHF